MKNIWVRPDILCGLWNVLKTPSPYTCSENEIYLLNLFNNMKYNDFMKICNTFHLKSMFLWPKMPLFRRKNLFKRKLHFLIVVVSYFDDLVAFTNTPSRDSISFLYLADQSLCSSVKDVKSFFRFVNCWLMPLQWRETLSLWRTSSAEKKILIIPNKYVYTSKTSNTIGCGWSFVSVTCITMHVVLNNYFLNNF